MNRGCSTFVRIPRASTATRISRHEGRRCMRIRKQIDLGIAIAMLFPAFTIGVSVWSYHHPRIWQSITPDGWRCWAMSNAQIAIGSYSVPDHLKTPLEWSDRQRRAFEDGRKELAHAVLIHWLEVLVFHRKHDTWSLVRPVFSHPDLPTVKFMVLPLWPVSVLCLLPIAFKSYRAARNRRRSNAGRCPACGYDVTGSLSKRCAECGRSTSNVVRVPR